MNRLLRGIPLLALLTLALPSRAAVVEQADVYVSGRDGYHTYRIPAVIRAANGDLLAFCEGRRESGSDTGDIDLLQKRSTDGGKTWGPAQVVWDDGANTCGNPCPVLDESTGTLFLLTTHNLGQDHEREIVTRSSVGTRTVWLLSSKDHGVTWTKPIDITDAAKDPSWTWYATGPGVGIQIKSGPHAGRLVIPCDHNYAAPAEPKGNGSGSHALYSDDHGRTWRRSEPIRPRLNECQVAELFDGRGTLLMNMRSNRGRHCRAEATSADGGQSWTPVKDAPALVEPVCQASLVRHDAARRLVFSNPADTKRVNMTVQTSSDDGQNWRRLAVLHPGPSAYSCLVPLDETTVGCLYERGEKKPYERITFARVRLRPE
ncbi:sialidase family protein [Opitutus sp. ER46]|uniref:sialidase family protein n=1 Tax=Opitutus sp. ER46 TaxID=2161864 RepID=UPI000D315FCA|nr:sialidase family protein [Opitutus sp. ER46]PTX99130.1 exo-alpha-sialidase [Opitutus sp. ER46]